VRSCAPLLALALWVPTGCSAVLPERVNVVLITVDTLRPDRLSCYGYQRHETPHIDRLAAEGALFEDAVSDAPWTTPSMTSVLTGVYPTRHGLRSTNAHRLAPEAVTLAEILRERGYATAAVIGSFPLDSLFGLDQGFDHYDDDFTRPIWLHPDHEPGEAPRALPGTPEERALFTLESALNNSRRSDAEVSDAAIAWLRDSRAEPFLLWVHYFGPHSRPDWTLSPAEQDRLHRERYDAGVREVDAEIGRLLDELDAQGLAARTLVVLHADHGESLGENGLLGHGGLLNEASMEVPLILRLPGAIPAGVRVRALVRNVDILPTVLDVAGGPAQLELSGRSLLPLARRGALARWLTPEEAPRVAYMETFYPAHKGFAMKLRGEDGTEQAVGFARRSVRRGRWRLERREPHPLYDVGPEGQPDLSGALGQQVRGEELYDLEDPAGEARNVIAAQPELVAELGALLDADRRRERDAAPRLELDAEERLRLRSLGYGD
jgi:arylsulfatase A-like enzyme